MARRILVVDDEESICRTLREILEDEGHNVEICLDGESALAILEKKEFDVILLDVWLPGVDGLEVLKRIQKHRYGVEVIMISGHATIETAVKATRLGACDFIEKPLSLERILLAVSNAIHRHQLEQQTILLAAKVEQEVKVLGESPAMQELKQQVRRAAPTASRVLILGENGTGKELIARLIHGQSPRSRGAFVEVNCAAIPSELIESELFGHKKGAFTGATEHKKGKFLLADGGSLFLDEVGDMSLQTQAKVLRVLEEQSFEPVGDTETRRVDVRVIAATNKDLPKGIEQGDFREDLYYRLNVIPLFVPALRERVEDIPLLCSHYLEFYSRQYGMPGKSLSPEAVEALKRYTWPGNVRELRNLMERLMIMAPGPVVGIDGLPMSAAAVDEEAVMAPAPLKQARERFEREYILKALGRNEWHITRTAEKLGIERRHLYRRMAALEIKKEADHGHD